MTPTPSSSVSPPTRGAECGVPLLNLGDAIGLWCELPHEHVDDWHEGTIRIERMVPIASTEEFTVRWRLDAIEMTERHEFPTVRG